MRKNTIYNITGCIVALIAGAWTQTAKAGYTDPQVMKARWEKDPGMLQRVFDFLFPAADDLELLGDRFPKSYKPRSLYRIHMAWADFPGFNTMTELKKIEVRIESKSNFFGSFSGMRFELSPAEQKEAEAGMMPKARRILQTLGSWEFLANFLDQETVNAICDIAVRKCVKTEIVFEVYSYFAKFFSPNGTGRIDMKIRQDNADVLRCEFYFKEKQNGDISMGDCKAVYRVGCLQYFKAEG